MKRVSGLVAVLCVLAVLGNTACTGGGAIFLGQPSAAELAKFQRFVEGIPPPSAEEVAQQVKGGEVYCRVGEYSGVTMSETVTVCWKWTITTITAGGGKWDTAAIHLASGTGFFPGVGTAVATGAVTGVLIGPLGLAKSGSKVLDQRKSIIDCSGGSCIVQ